ncbi:Ig domain-containing protein, partial [Pontiella sp.]|uniref:Ig domain-containing protein n=1 Tax=Pontiella sp. TaxID=2837462 RepID=UPI00356B1805
GTTKDVNKWSVNHVEVSVGIAWRADWMRGAWGLAWAPEDLYNGRSETLVDDYEAFLNQIDGLKTLDYIQLNLGMSYIYSPVHLGPHDLLESFWRGDTDDDGEPINLIVPRASSGIDPLGAWARATQAAGLNVQVYVNSSQLLQRGDIPNPSVIPDITERWTTWCDTNTAAQAFIASQSYHTNGINLNRPYMFCYAEFVLKPYSIRYGELIDSWIFDSGSFMSGNGDNATNGVAADQRIYQAFADAARAGNPHATVAFNNSPERDTEALNPFSEAVRCEDYMFGHPYNGGNNIGSHTIGDPPLYDRNYALIEKMTETGGNVHAGESSHDWTWDDRVVGHFYPPMSTTAWNAGSTPALTDEEFLLWNLEAMQAGGALSWGAPLRWPPGSGVNLLINDWGMAQLTLMDAYLSTNEVPGAPQWTRQDTPLPDAVIGQAYYHVLFEGVHFWDPEGDAITNVAFASSADGVPSWLTLEQAPGQPATWRFVGVPNETAAAQYRFRLRVEDASGGSDRWVELTVNGNSVEFMPGESGDPVWAADPLELPDATVGEAYANYLVQGLDFMDYEETDLAVSLVGGTGWLSLGEVAPGWWQLSGTPSPADAGIEALELSVSDGVNEAVCTLVLTVEPAVSRLAILAAANKNYGTGETATMLSDVQTAYDGLATFQVAIDVVPGPGTAIRSGDGGGATTSQSWGIFSPGETDNARYIFNGGAGEFAERIGNIRIVGFDEGGGRLSVGDIRALSFQSVTIADAQSGGKDSVYVAVGSVTNDLSDLGSNNQTIELEALSGAMAPVTGFSLGTSTTNVLNKWSVNSIEVRYSILGPETYSTWAYDHGLAGAAALAGADSVDRDGYPNLMEFALGMDPNQADARSRESVGRGAEGGTNYIEFVHARRTDFAEQGVSYLLVDSTNLAAVAASTNAQDQIRVGPAVAGFETVTNRYAIDPPARFIQLKIRQD